MSATIFIPTPLRPYTGDQESLELEGSTVGEVLRNLAEQYGDLKKHLFDEEGKLRNFVNIYVNDEDIRYLDREETAIQDKDTISIVPSIAGGAPWPIGRRLRRPNSPGHQHSILFRGVDFMWFQV